MSFVVGICELTLSLSDITSLKEKRSVMRRVVLRTRNRHPIAIAEVDELDSLGVGVIAFAVVSNDRRFVNSLVDRIVDFIEDLGLAPVEDYQFEILSY